MKAANYLFLPAFAVLAACSSEPDASRQGLNAEPAAAEEAAAEAPENKFGFHESLEQGPSLPNPAADARNAAKEAASNAGSDARRAAEAAADTPASQSTANAPKIAYAYSFGFTVPGENMTKLQRRHAQICEKMGPQSCRVMEMNNAGDEGDYAYGELELEVAASQAKAFGGDLAKSAEEMGGKQTSSAISGEDLSKQIIDTEARLQARLLLRDRLMGLLARHSGSVSELVEAERAVADVNAEIDEAQRSLKAMNGRIEFSAVRIDYRSESRNGAGFLEPIVLIFSSLGAILGWLIAGLLVITIALVPITLFIEAWRWVLRRVKAVLHRPTNRPAASEPEA